MKIELHAEKYVIRRSETYFQFFQCFTADAALWISTPYLAHHFADKGDAESALAEIRKQRRKVKA